MMLALIFLICRMNKFLPEQSREGKFSKSKLKIYSFKNMSGIGGSEQFGLRWQAIGLKSAGKTCRAIARELNVHFATVSGWCNKYDEGESQEDKPRSGRPSVLDRVSKIVIAKSLTKKR